LKTEELYEEINCEEVLKTRRLRYGFPSGAKAPFFADLYGAAESRALPKIYLRWFREPRKKIRIEWRETAAEKIKPTHCAV
jgi:hypothetical protein